MPINSIVGIPGTIVNEDDSSTSQTISRTSSQRTSTLSSSTNTVVISEGAAPTPSPSSSSSPSLTASAIVTETTAAASSSLTTAAAQPQGTPAGSIAGLVIGLLLLVGLILFGVRWFFIRKREHKSTPARSRISRLNISGPSNFTHLQSGAADGSATQMATPTPSNRPTATADANAVAASPYDRIKQKYSFDLNQLETGLSDHMETMKSSRKNAPSQ